MSTSRPVRCGASILRREEDMADPFADLAWLNPPLAETRESGRLTVKTRGATDFWQETFYGFHRHSGHFLHRTVSGDFTALVKFLGRYEALYDQAGLMVRADETHWIKS